MYVNTYIPSTLTTMDLDIIQSTKEGEITQFLCDVRDYFKSSLATSEYENTSNMFFLTASESTERLLVRCECLLNRLNNKSQKLQLNSNTFTPLNTPHREKANADGVQRNSQRSQHEDVSYLDMSASHRGSNNNGITKTEIVDLNSSGDSEKTFRCSTLVVRQNKSFLHRLQDTLQTITDDETDMGDGDNENQGEEKNHFEDDPQIYDICQVTTQGSDGEEDEVGLEETQKVITPESDLPLPNIECPYMDLPAGHLAINKSEKYGQLMRIEKRLFFDQSKKYYCGILNDWLLCYSDGPTSNSPSVSLYLKVASIEIEHFGEGKRRDVCFQITTCDPNKRFVFQAINEIDAKEWIHAIEAAIRRDTTGIDIKKSSTRKLPTPPVIKKLTFLSPFQRRNEILSNSTSSTDCIYEEPSSNYQYPTTHSSEKRPELPHKQSDSLSLAHKFEYDVPKCPPQPLQQNSDKDILLVNPFDNNPNNSPEKTHTECNDLPSTPPVSTQKLCSKLEENLDFQAKVKDVHNKLTSQLSSGPNIMKSFKKSPSSSAQTETESQANAASSILSAAISPSPTAAELKKQKKTTTITTPPNSPQKAPNEKSSFARNWFLNRLNKTNCSTRSNSSSPSNSPSKCKQSEKENLLNTSSDFGDDHDIHSISSPVSSISKSSPPNRGTSKVNMIINQLEASGHLASLFSVDAVATFSSFCDTDCNNYEPIMTVSTPPNNLMKKV